MPLLAVAATAALPLVAGAVSVLLVFGGALAAVVVLLAVGSLAGERGGRRVALA